MKLILVMFFGSLFLTMLWFLFDISIAPFFGWRPTKSYIEAFAACACGVYLGHLWLGKQ